MTNKEPETVRQDAVEPLTDQELEAIMPLAEGADVEGALNQVRARIETEGESDSDS